MQSSHGINVVHVGLCCYLPCLINWRNWLKLQHGGPSNVRLSINEMLLIHKLLLSRRCSQSYLDVQMCSVACNVYWHTRHNSSNQSHLKQGYYLQYLMYIYTWNFTAAILPECMAKLLGFGASGVFSGRFVTRAERRILAFIGSIS